MNQQTKTILAVVIALLAVLLAWITRPAPITDARFADIGQPLLPGLTDPAQVASLEVIAYDDEAARHLAFKVEFDGALWRIVSASNYPADAAAKISEAASAFVGLHRESIVTDRRLDHASLGLVDPTDESGDPSGRGVRVTIRDESGFTLADLIVGHHAGENTSSNERFVRLAASDRAYRTTFQTSLATALSIDLRDWIDTDLLRVASGDIVWISLDAYALDEALGQRVEGERFHLNRDVSRDAWTLGAGAQPTDAGAVESVLNAIADLRIVGVEPKPRKFASLLAGDAANVELGNRDVLRMQRSGFFLSSEGRLIANAGELRFRTAQGLEYTLWFGEILARTNAGGAIFADTIGPGLIEAVPGSRALLVTVAAIDPDNKDASTAAAAISRKYADWWYLIDESSFDRLRPALADLQDSSPEQPAP